MVVIMRVKDSSKKPMLANKQSGSQTRDLALIVGRGNCGMGTVASPDSAISRAGACDGLHMATLCPRLASSRAIGTMRVGKPKSFEISIVNKKRAIDTSRS